MTRARAIKGVTIIELLIAMSIFGVILTLGGQLLTSTSRAYRVNEDQSQLGQVVQAATELLQYEVGLAGYRCVDPDSFRRSFPGRPLEVINGGPGESDTVIVRYHEDRFVDGCTQVEARFFAEDGVLYRGSGGEPTPLVHGITDLQVSHWLNHANSEFLVPTRESNPNNVRPPDDSLAGLGLLLEFGTGSESAFQTTITIGLTNSQCAAPGAGC